MSSTDNPKANVFIMINLGCEMLYVIDQRLKAQQITLEKSTQVIHDVISVLLDTKFVDAQIVGSTKDNAQLLTEEHCKFMLKDVATCSLMRLDETSMNKLWNLMTVILKWQLFQTRHAYQLIDVTFRHLEGIGKLYPDDKTRALMDFTKNTILDFWNICTDAEQLSIYLSSKSWLNSFSTKISVLIRLGFQSLDGSFIEHGEQSYFQEFKNSIGDNIYTKSAEIAELQREELAGNSSASTSKCVNQLAEMLNFTKTSEHKSNNIAPQHNLQQYNMLFEDFDVDDGKRTTMEVVSSGQEEFVNLNPIYNKQSVLGDATNFALR